MANYDCPDCGGGFPEVPPERECPWCGHPMNGEKQRGPFDPADSTIPMPDESDVTPDASTPSVDVDLSTGNDGTTPCPECGGPMPMVTWTGPKPECRECRRNKRNSLGGNRQ